MQKGKLDRMWIGTVAGLFGPVLGFLSFYVITSTHKTLTEFTKMIINTGDTHSAILSVSLIFNLALFFGALRKDWLYAARGVILATILYAPFVVYFKYG